jgi:2-polyprenyl-3-methyl-5-hydroxy-6-metoxy-1,4-benzoquinol methylase
MSYADITFDDKNSIKRWLQRRRLVVATRIVDKILNPKCVLDFGAGNGELCKLIALQFPNAKIICYEPVPSLMKEAKANLTNLPQVHFCSDVAEIPDGSIELLFCLEVLEHLPKAETDDAIRSFNRMLSGDGSAVIGVPVEIGVPALYKGVFRMSRRFGEFDASIKNTLLATLCVPPKERPVREIAPGFSYHHDHMGFDYRNLRNLLRARFKLQKLTTSPFSLFGPWLNPEANFLVQKDDSVGNAGVTR